MVVITMPDRPQPNGYSPLLTRQAVVDAPMRVQGYRLQYAAPGVGVPLSVGDELALFEELFGGDALGELVGDLVAHIPVSGALLRELGQLPLRPNRVVLRLHHEDAVQPAVFSVIEELAGRGYVIELDALPGPNIDFNLMAPFGVVEIDITRWSRSEIEALMPKLAADEVTALAVGVRDHAERQEARAMGFSWFAGPFLTTPRVIEERAIPHTALTVLVDVSRLQGDDTPLEDVVRVLERDPRLSAELLRYVNSAQFGVSDRVHSVRHATMLLGSRNACQWALRDAMHACSRRLMRETVIIALTRASMCERLAERRPGVDPHEMFTVGLLSMIDALVGAPLDALLDGLPLEGDVIDGIRNRSGIDGEILSAVIAYEEGRFDAPELGAFLALCPGAYRAALRWATNTISVLG